MKHKRLKKVQFAVDNFIEWLDRYGEISWDHQTFFAGGAGAAAKALYYKNALLGTLAVAPIIFCEAFLPGARRFSETPALSYRRRSLRYGVRFSGKWRQRPLSS